MNSFDTFTLAPMSAGDIIDRAVRLYRQNFLVLLRIVVAPSLVAYLGSILMSIGWRNFNLEKGDLRVVSMVILMMGGVLVWAIGYALFFAVIGGSSQSLVAHFLEGKPILARDVYRAVRERLGSLIGALLMTALIIFGVMIIASLILNFLIMILVLALAALLAGMPDWAQGVLGVITILLSVLVVFTLFLLVLSRIAYVPQILMVEKKSVFSSIGRSFTLANGQIIRIGALFLFWTYVSWSLVWLLFIPLGWASDWIIPINTEAPLWYDIAWQTLTKLSEILLMPVFMIGCTLLYLDSRVRKEGFDIELLANRAMTAPQLAMPGFQAAIPRNDFNYATVPPPPSILGLNDYSTVTAMPDSSPAASLESRSSNGTIAGGEAPDRHQEESRQFAAAETTALDVDARQEYETTQQLYEPPTTAIDAEVEVEGKICQWCGTRADVEDRFCRVCGSVF